MSLDNVLAVAGAAREHPIVLVFGLLLSIALMGVAANFVARLLQKHRWIAYVGLAIKRPNSWLTILIGRVEEVMQALVTMGAFVACGRPDGGRRARRIGERSNS